MAEFLSTGKASKMEYSDLRQGKRKSSVGRNFLAKKKKKRSQRCAYLMVKYLEWGTLFHKKCMKNRNSINMSLTSNGQVENIPRTPFDVQGAEGKNQLKQR